MSFLKADYKDIDPKYGTLADVEHLIAELRKRDMKLMMDLVRPTRQNSNFIQLTLWQGCQSHF